MKLMMNPKKEQMSIILIFNDKDDFIQERILSLHVLMTLHL